MNSEERIDIKGAVEVVAHDANGNELYRAEYNNLVVLNGRQRMARLLSGDSTQFIDYFRIGTGTTAPATSDTGLQTPANISAGVTQKAIDTAEYPATNKVRFIMSLSTSQGNGNSLSEYGLYTADDVLFARVVVPPYAKTNAAALTIKWTITF